MHLLALGRKGGVRPLLLLYGPTVNEAEVSAPAYSVLYPVVRRSEELREMRLQPDKTWATVRGGLRVSLPRQEAGHHLHESITLKRRTHK